MHLPSSCLPYCACGRFAIEGKCEPMPTLQSRGQCVLTCYSLSLGQDETKLGLSFMGLLVKMLRGIHKT